LSGSAALSVFCLMLRETMRLMEAIDAEIAARGLAAVANGGGPHRVTFNDLA
jgi:hypothetical protein